MLTQVFLYTKDAKYLKPIPDAIKWLESSELRENTWARLYEVKTNKPIYGQHDRIPHYLQSEGRTDYRFIGDFGIKKTIAYVNKVLEQKENYKEEEMTQGPGKPKLTT